MKGEVDRKGWTLYQDTHGNSIFPVPGEGQLDCVFWLCHGERRICLQVPMKVLAEGATNG